MSDINMVHVADKIESVYRKIIYSKPEDSQIIPTPDLLEDLKDALCAIDADIRCKNVLFTQNTDKLFFGVQINPGITSQDAVNIVTGEPTIINNYTVELDSKLFDLDLDADEFAAFLLFEITNYMFRTETLEDVQHLIDLHILANDEIINIRDSVNYSQILIYGIKDALSKVSSSLYKEDPDDLQNQYIIAANLIDSLLSAHQKILSSAFGIGEAVRSPKVFILKHVLMVYTDMNHNARLFKEALKESKEFTASKLLQIEIDKTIQSMDRINAQTIIENKPLASEFNRIGMQSLNEVSLFKSLKTSGLRGIEDALYEYAIRIKTCKTEEEALDILHCINTRLSILEDYVYNTPDLPDNERERWLQVISDYRKLRDTLSKKKLIGKKYGLFFDYDQLNYMDAEPDDE